jgi:hypothetical protein
MIYITWKLKTFFFLTATTESLAATAKMSAHDTIPAHAVSTWDLTVSITSNPLSELLLGPATFSPSLPSNSTDASHPCYIIKLVIFFVSKKPIVYLTNKNIKTGFSFTLYRNTLNIYISNTLTNQLNASTLYGFMLYIVNFFWVNNFMILYIWVNLENWKRKASHCKDFTFSFLFTRSLKNRSQKEK